MKIRNLKQDDASLMLEWMHDDFVVHDLKTDFSKKTIEDCRNFISASENNRDNIHLAVTDDEDIYMGTVSLKNIKDGTAEFAITIRRCAMGKGFSAFGMKEIIRLAFEKYGLEQVYWCVDPINKRAVRFYDKNGYKRSSAPKYVSGYSADEINYYLWYSTDKKSFVG